MKRMQSASGSSRSSGPHSRNSSTSDMTGSLAMYSAKHGASQPGAKSPRTDQG